MRAAVMTLALPAWLVSGCGGAPEEAQPREENTASTESPLTFSLYGVACDTSMTLTGTAGRTDTWWVTPAWGTSSCPLPPSASRMYIKVEAVNMVGCGGGTGDCPYVDVLNPDGSVTLNSSGTPYHYTSPLAVTQYPKISTPGVQNGQQTFGIRIYHPSWYTASSTSITLQILTW
jgi:hypothetical protein